MKHVNTSKHILQKPYNFFQKDNLIALSVFAIIVIYFYIAFYKRVYYPTRQIFKRKNESGYIMIDGGFEHRILAEQWLGRKLTPDEEVHHINGKRWDNSRANLAVISRENHRRWHARLEWMFANKMFPSIKTQRSKLINEFGARLF